MENEDAIRVLPIIRWLLAVFVWFWGIFSSITYIFHRGNECNFLVDKIFTLLPSSNELTQGLNFTIGLTITIFAILLVLGLNFLWIYVCCLIWNGGQNEK